MAEKKFALRVPHALELRALRAPLALELRARTPQKFKKVVTFFSKKTKKNQEIVNREISSKTPLVQTSEKLTKLPLLQTSKK